MVAPSHRREKLAIETKRDLAIRKAEATALEELQKLEQDYQNEMLSKREKESTGPSICQLCYDLDEAGGTFFFKVKIRVTDAVKPVFIPCGHRICSSCLSSMGYSPEKPIAFTCPWDRKEIARVVMLDPPSDMP